MLAPKRARTRARVSRARARSYASLSPVLDPLLPHLVEMLRLAEEAYAPNARRWSLFSCTYVLSMTCKEGQRIAAQHHPLLLWMWTYETHVKPPVVREPLAPSAALLDNRRFCDGLPPCFNPADEQLRPWGPRAHPSALLNNPASSGRHAYDPVFVLTTRKTMAQRIAAHVPVPDPRPAPSDLSGHDRSIGFPEDYDATGGGLPDGLPEPVRRFLGFVRYWSNVLHSSLYLSTKVRICDHKHCLRTCSAQPPPGAKDQTGFAGDYWAFAIAGLQNEPMEMADWPPHMCYCSKACFDAAGAEFLSKVRCCSEPELEAAPAPPRVRRAGGAGGGDPGPARLYRAALERNQVVGRRLREQGRHSGDLLPNGDVRFLKHFRFAHPRIGLHSQGAALLDYQAAFVDALNIDAGLLFAASIVSELPAAHRQYKVLPWCARWREGTILHRNALCRVRQLYAEHHLKKQTRPSTSADLVTSTSGTRPAWLEAVKTHAQTIF